MDRTERLNNHSNFSIMDQCDVIKNVTWSGEGNTVPSVRGKRILTKTCRTSLIFSGRKQENMSWNRFGGYGNREDRI